MKSWLSYLSALLLFSASATQVSAQQITAQLDPAATHVEFTLSDTLHTVHGNFQLKSGAISFDPATGRASGKLVVDASSGKSGNQSRDKKMSNEILEVQKFPEIVFTAHEVIGKTADAGPAHLEIRGTFSIHGQHHPMTLLVDTQTQADAIDALTKFVVPYVAWGMKNPSLMFLKVGDKVEISIRTRVHLAQVASAR